MTAVYKTSAAYLNGLRKCSTNFTSSQPPLFSHSQPAHPSLRPSQNFAHILFLVALCAVYRIEQWRRLTILVTAFTVGHSITLALSALDIVTIPSEIIEFLIPTTILLTALHNVISRPSESLSGIWISYAMALFFGFIHGMGFSNFFRALLMGDDSILIPLLAFNLGIELGQLMVVGFIVGVAFLFLKVLGVKHRDWNLFVSGAAAGIAVMLMVETKFW